MNVRKVLHPFLMAGVLEYALPVAAASEGETAMAAPAASVPNATPAPDSPAIADKMNVAMNYTLTVDGKVVDSSEGREPLHYVHGSGQIIPGLEQALIGLKAGDSKEVTVAPEQGYGMTDPSAIVEVPKTQLPPNVTPTVGMTLRGQTPEGEGFSATIKEVRPDSVLLDLNHPLAGKTLHFKVTITDVKPAP